MRQRSAVEEFVGVAQMRSYAPRSNILNAGDEPCSLFYIIEGSVSVLIREGKREMVLAYLNPGDFFGEMCLFPELNTRSAIVRSRTPVLVAEMDLANFRGFAARHPDIMFTIAGQIAMRLRDTSRRLRDLAFLDVAGRIAHVLLDLSSKPDAMETGGGRAIRTSRQELARMVGCSREMAGRVLKRLEEDGVIACKGRVIVVLERGGAPSGQGRASA